MKTDQEIIQLLFDTGHLNHPYGQAIRSQVVRDGQPSHGYGPLRLAQLQLGSGQVVHAIASYQDFMTHDLERLCLKHHGRPAHADGDIGQATRDLFEIERCGCPDYGEAHDHYQPKIGTGNWPGCHGIGDFHAAAVYVDDRQMPSFLEPVFEKVWARTVGAYQEIGLQLIRVQNPGEANIVASFVLTSRGWIGLAVVGHGKSCGSQIWCKYLARYRPSNVVGSWTELFMHEIGHNCGLNHTRGGIMNPSLISGLPPTWDNDPSESVLNRYYGGEPIPVNDGPIGGKYWVEHGFRSERGEEVWVPLVPPQLREVQYAS